MRVAFVRFPGSLSPFIWVTNPALLGVLACMVVSSRLATSAFAVAAEWRLTVLPWVVASLGPGFVQCLAVWSVLDSKAPILTWSAKMQDVFSAASFLDGEALEACFGL